MLSRASPGDGALMAKVAAGALRVLLAESVPDDVDATPKRGALLSVPWAPVRVCAGGALGAAARMEPLPSETQGVGRQVQMACGASQSAHQGGAAAVEAEGGSGLCAHGTSWRAGGPCGGAPPELRERWRGLPRGLRPGGLLMTVGWACPRERGEAWTLGDGRAGPGSGSGWADLTEPWGDRPRLLPTDRLPVRWRGGCAGGGMSCPCAAGGRWEGGRAGSPR